MSELTESDQKLLFDVANHGWHVLKITDNNYGPGFCYSVGLYKNYGHPEIVILGLKLDLAHSLINSIGDEIKSGRRFESGKFYSDIISGFDCLMLLVEKKSYKNHFGYGRWFYKSDDFPVLQCIYPTVKGFYPWQNEWPEEIKNLQPVLGSLPDALKNNKE